MTMIIVCIAVIVGAIGLDQLSKWLVVSNLEHGESIPIIEDVLDIHYVLNYDMIFGWDTTPITRWIVIVISILGVLGILFYLFYFKPREWYLYVPLSMIAGGGIGNLIDRLFYGEKIGTGGVIDFVDFCAFPSIWSYIFNVADIFVCVGAFSILLYLVIDIINDSKKSKKEGKKDA